MKDCVFCKIGSHVIPKEFEYEDNEVMVFPDINPSKDIHILVVPKKHVEDFLELKDSKLMTKLFNTAQAMIKKQGLAKKGYRILFNGGGAAAIDHLHIHIIGPIDRNFRI